jgi:hypothetical protein
MAASCVEQILAARHITPARTCEQACKERALVLLVVVSRRCCGPVRSRNPGREQAYRLLSLTCPWTSRERRACSGQGELVLGRDKSGTFEVTKSKELAEEGAVTCPKNQSRKPNTGTAKEYATIKCHMEAGTLGDALWDAMRIENDKPPYDEEVGWVA